MVFFVLMLIPFVVVLTVVRPEQGTAERVSYEKQDTDAAYYVVCEQDAGSISVPLETALVSVLGGIMDADAPEEALYAMAILLRTQAVYDIEQTGSCIIEGYASDAELRERWGKIMSPIMPFLPGRCRKRRGLL